MTLKSFIEFRPHLKLQNEIKMPVLLGHVVPNFKADTTIGPIDFHEFITSEPGKWVILFR